MLISLVIPVYNTSKYLEKCLTSILGQSYKNIEVILVDDCSTDNSYEILKRFQDNDNRIQVFKNVKNSLVGVSRNLGIKKASGDYIWFVDSDDWLNPRAIEDLVEIIKEAQETDLVLFGYTEYFSKGKYNVIEKLPKKIPDTENAFAYFLQLRKGFCSMPFAYLFSREFLLTKKTVFPENVYFEDILFIAKAIFYSKNIKIISKSLYAYNRQNESSITQSHSKKKVLDLLKIYDRLKQFLENEEALKKYKSLLIIRFLVFGLPRCFKMYFQLSKKERKDLEFKRELFSYRKSPIMGAKVFNGVGVFIKTLENDEAITKKEYRRNIGYLFWIKNALWPLKALLWVLKIHKKLRSTPVMRLFL